MRCLVTFKCSGTCYYIQAIDGLVVNRHRSFVDVLSRSIAACVSANAFGIIMTSTGDDEARGLKEMRAAIGSTIVQNEASCMMPGIPKEAISLGGVRHI
ncbi:chemotaxis protein CheB [Steroidobacter denitrificans]